MASPSKPVAILPDHTYIHVSSNLAPDAISAALESSEQPDVKLEYRGPVGELEGEYIFEVASKAGEPVKRSGDLWSAHGDAVVHSVRAVPGVGGAEVLEAKRRPKRDEF
ncbi:hypothetical protein VHUM_03763 [Vanrija humicola]|uniref:Uncharacterized protein n=1 Tax=Vanrija humicola TaxID=5417 RepID=A0A7D8YWR7_VANHU|nr:hypothetical protein VHUM_03763 [Vanrija humicola]